MVGVRSCIGLFSRQTGDCLFQDCLAGLPAGPCHPDGRLFGLSSRNDGLSELGRVLEHEAARGERDFVDRAESAAEIDRAVDPVLTGVCAAELAPEIPHDVNVRSREAVDRLPVITNGKDPGIAVLGLERADKAGSAVDIS